MNRLPCPFCGSTNVKVLDSSNYITCQKCNCFGPSMSTTKADMFLQREILLSMIWDLWNTRSTTEEKTNE